MALFFPVLAKEYDPYHIDEGMFAINLTVARSVPVVCSKMIDKNTYGKVTVDGIEVSKGRCDKFDFSPFPFLFIPVGEAAQEFDKTYTVKLSGFKAVDRSRFKDCTFTLKTKSERKDDGKHELNEKATKNVSENATLQHNVKQIIKVLVRCI